MEPGTVLECRDLASCEDFSAYWNDPLRLIISLAAPCYQDLATAIKQASKRELAAKYQSICREEFVRVTN
jgi:hypothetical protein